MTAKYADDPDVQKLVKVVNDFLNADYRELQGPYLLDMNKAIKPFLPNPEEELIEAMAKRAWSRLSRVRVPSWENLYQEVRTSWKDDMRVALDAVKSAGWRAPDHD